MNKTKNKTKSIVAAQPKIEHFSDFAPSKTSLSKKFRAVVGIDKAKRPAWFLFDLYAFWEFLCRIDEELLFDKLSDKDYVENPVGKLIDKIESHWPFSNEYKKEMQQEYDKILKEISSGKMQPYEV